MRRKQAKSKRTTKLMRWIALAVAAASTLPPMRAQAQDGVSLDDVMRQQLNLGGAAGCVGGSATENRLYSELYATNGIGGGGADKANVEQLRNSSLFSPALLTLCTRSANNLSSASQSGGALGSLQSTLSVAQFNVSDRRRRRAHGIRPRHAFETRQVQYAQADTVMMDATTDPEDDNALSLFFNATQVERDLEGNRLDAAQDYSGYSVVAGVDKMFGDVLVGGYARFGSADADSSPSSAVVTGTNGQVISGLPIVLVNNGPAVSAQSICNQDPKGSSNEDAYGVGFYGAADGPGGVSFSGNIEFARRDVSAERGVCYIETNQVNTNLIFTDVFSGVLSSDTSVDQIAISFFASKAFAFDAVQVTPRFGVRYGREEIGGYTETGRSVVSQNLPANGTGDFDQSGAVDPPNEVPVYRRITNVGDPTGLELTYADRSIESVQTELGVDVRTVIGMSGDWTLAPIAGAAFVHEFDDDLRTVSFHFAGDKRPTPKQLAYNSSAPDSDYYTASLGVVLQSPDGWAFFGEAQGVYDNERYDEHSVMFGVRKAF